MVPASKMMVISLIHVALRLSATNAAKARPVSRHALLVDCSNEADDLADRPYNTCNEVYDRLNGLNAGFTFTRLSDGQFEVGEQVEGKWGSKWYNCKVEAVNEDGTYKVSYYGLDDAKITNDMAPTWLRQPKRQPIDASEDSSEDSEESKKRLKRWPTAANVRTKLTEMIGNAKPGDTCVFVYAGHGDGYDPEDGGRPRTFLVCTGRSYEGNPNIKSEYHLWDDDLHAILNKAQAGVKILVLLGCCHSGYMAGLPYQLHSDWKPKPNVGSGTRGQKFLARYEKWSGDWKYSDLNFGHPQPSPNRPFIITISACEISEKGVSWG